MVVQRELTNTLDGTDDQLRGTSRGVMIVFRRQCWNSDVEATYYYYYYYYHPNLENWCVMFNLQGSMQLGNTETVVFLL